MTVSGLTVTSADRQSAQTPVNHAQNTRSAYGQLWPFLGGASKHTDLMAQRQDLHLESCARTED
jgi:hypothetical protein